MLLNMIGVDEADDVVDLSGRRIGRTGDPASRITLTTLVEAFLESFASATTTPPTSDGSRDAGADVTAIHAERGGAPQRDVA